MYSPSSKILKEEREKFGRRIYVEREQKLKFSFQPINGTIQRSGFNKQEKGNTFLKREEY